MEYKMIGITFKNPENPHVRQIYTERTRGHINYDTEHWNCEFCGTCALNCPADAIVVDDNEFTWTIDRFSCIQCGCCVRTCLEKTKSITMRPEYTPAAIAKSRDVYIAPEEDEDDEEDF